LKAELTWLVGYNQPPMSTQLAIPPGLVNRVPVCLAGVMTGHVLLCRMVGNTV